MSEKLYYVERSASGYVGNCLLFWRKGGKGYGCDLKEAEVFTVDDLRSISRDGKYRVWPKEYIDARATFTVDHQYLELNEGIKDADLEQTVFSKEPQ